MKKSILSLALVAAGAIAADVTAEDVNYGDPMASFKTVGISAGEHGAQVNTMVGLGSNIFQLDVTLGDANSRDSYNYRGRYFHITDGLGYSLDIMGGESKQKDSANADRNQMVLAGLMTKMEITEQFWVFPMVSAGHSSASNNYSSEKTDTAVARAGAYVMYAFEAGHWLYAEPSITHSFDSPKNATYANYDRNQVAVDIGGGYMLNEWSAAEFKVEHSFGNDTKRENGDRRLKDNTVGWLKYSIFW